MQAGFLFQGLIQTGKYTFRSLGGALKHTDYKIVQPHVDLVVKPVDGFGTKEQLRHLLLTERPDALFLFTDPRQFTWVWEMEDEIHQICPIVYWHVWDNDPYPEFNKVWYDSTDLINCLSHKTYELVKPNFPEKTNYIPHAFPKEVFFPLPEEIIRQQMTERFGAKADWFKVLWVSRNATRKLPADVIACFREFLDALEETHGHRKALLVMHTDPLDIEGPNLHEVKNHYGLGDHVFFSTDKLPHEGINLMHNLCDVLINIAKAEGFGLCQSGTTQITCQNGYKSLGDVQVGDEVLSNDGIYHRVLAKTSRRDTTLKIKTYGKPVLTSSNNHPYLVSCGPDSDKHWKRADELAVGDLLCAPRAKNLFDSTKPLSDRLDLLDWLVDKSTVYYDANFVWYKMGYSGYKNGLSISDIQKKYQVSKWYAEHTRRYLLQKPSGRKVNQIKINCLAKKILEDEMTLNNNLVKIKRFIPITPELFKVFGWYLAEGSSSNGKGIEFDLHKKEAKVADWLRDFFIETFGIETGTAEIYRANSSRFYCSSAILAQFFEKTCGKHAKHKSIHPEVFDYLCDEDLASALLNSLFLGDGSHGKTRWILRLISDRLIKQTQNLLDHYGIFSKFGFQKPRKTSKIKVQQDQYSVYVTGTDYDRFCKLTNLPHRVRVGVCHKKNKFYLQDHDFFYVPVEKITKSNETEELFDIQVENSQNFVANGVVAHNSTLQNLMVGKPVIALQTGGMTRQVVDYRDGSHNGVGISPTTRILVGSQSVPFIYEDFCSHQQVVEAFMKIYEMTPKEKTLMRQKVLSYADHEFKYENVIRQWDESLEATIKAFKGGKKKKTWEFKRLDNPVPPPTQKEKTQLLLQQNNIVLDPKVAKLPIDLTGHLLKTIQVERART